jgi:hypothetical protein
MQKLYILILFLLASFGASAQTVLNFTVNQLPALVAHAGADQVIKKGAQANLGGAPAATGGTGSYTYSWTPTTGLSSTTVANPVATPTTNTTYTLTVNDNKGCSQVATVTVTVNAVTGINDQADALGLQIFPNPNTGTFLITSDKRPAGGRIQLEVFNSLGKLIYAESLAEESRKLDKTIKLPAEVKGVLVIRLSGRELNTTRKIIVQ